MTTVMSLSRRLSIARLVAILGVLPALGTQKTAGACAACACGDTTLTAFGLEKPYQNRLRLGFEERFSWLTQGDQANGDRIVALRSALTVTWVPTPRLALGLLLPWLATWTSPLTGSGTQQINGLSDLEVSGRLLVFRDRSFAPRHLLFVTGGIKLPTGPRLTDGRNFPYPDDQQVGSGSFDPFGGATYGWFGGFTSVFASASYRYTTAGPRGYRVGSFLGGSAAVQLQPWWWGAFQLGSDLRWATADSLPNGHDAPNTGGTVVYLTPGLLFTATRSTNLLVRVAIAIPVFHHFDGIQSVGPQMTLMLAYDLR